MNGDEILFTDLGQDARLVADKIGKNLPLEVKQLIVQQAEKGAHVEVRVAMTRQGYRFALVLCNAFSAVELWAGGAGVEVQS